MNLPDLADLMRQKGIAEVQFGDEGQIVRMVLTKEPPPEVVVPAPLHPDPDVAAHIEARLTEEELAKRLAEETRAYERVAFAATEGIAEEELR